jgi:3-oxoadipate enol-lactonase
MNKGSMRCVGKNLKITVNKLVTCYNDEGPDHAPVIIFIHGFPLNKSMWNYQAEALKDKYRVLAYDIRGHGDSEEGTEGFTIDLFARDLLGLMDILKIDTAMLCGLSMGGYIALHAIEKYPGRFYALVLSDTQCAADSPAAKENRVKAIENIKEKGVEYYANLSIKNLFAPLFFDTNAEQIVAVRAMILETSPQSLIKTLIALSIRYETCSKLPEIDVPVLILVGKEDMITPPEVALFMHKKIRGSGMYILDHCGHLSNIEDQTAFNDQLKIFAGSVTDPTRCLSYQDLHRV